MWYKVVGPVLNTIHQKLNVRTPEGVDELLACEIRVYVIICIFQYFYAYSAYFVYFDIWRICTCVC